MAKKGGFGGFPGFGSGGGMQEMILKQVQRLQEEQERLMNELGETQVQGSAGGGVVVATATGSGDLVSVKIDPDAVDPDDVEMLEDMVVAAVRDALAKAQSLREEKLGTLMSGLPKIPGLSF